MIDFHMTDLKALPRAGPFFMWTALKPTHQCCECKANLSMAAANPLRDRRQATLREIKAEGRRASSGRLVTLELCPPHWRAFGATARRFGCTGRTAQMVRGYGLDKALLF
ncbi:MAG: hypothetical protein AAF382_16355 [Pseudomonadota bacterium]